MIAIRPVPPQLHATALPDRRRTTIGALDLPPSTVQPPPLPQTGPPIRKPQPSPNPAIPKSTDHPTPNPLIPKSTDHPAPNPLIPKSTDHPAPNPLIPKSTDHPTQLDLTPRKFGSDFPPNPDSTARTPVKDANFLRHLTELTDPQRSKFHTLPNRTSRPVFATKSPSPLPLSPDSDTMHPSRRPLPQLPPTGPKPIGETVGLIFHHQYFPPATFFWRVKFFPSKLKLWWNDSVMLMTTSTCERCDVILIVFYCLKCVIVVIKGKCQCGVRIVLKFWKNSALRLKIENWKFWRCLEKSKGFWKLF